ncbi:M48 family metalloprotease [Acidovorax lacteus]|uniref:Peptidase M48 domain-containing protein n=1 Tax=Acidovorax lacteus TaxID=1924988 RepID=A0ABP8LDH9_9BURK
MHFLRHLLWHFGRPLTVWALGTLAWGGLSLPAQAQEESVLKRATALRASPSDGAASVAELAQSVAVTRTGKRQGAWLEVRTPAGATGWLHLFDIGTATRESAATSSLRAVGGLVGGPSGPVGIATSTAGIRGLGEGDVARATGAGRTGAAHTDVLRHLDEAHTAADEARAFAQAAALHVRAVESLPGGPVATAASGSAAAGASAGATVGADPGTLLQSVDAITEAQEVALGRQMAAQLLAGRPMDPTPGLQRYVNQLGRWLSLQSARPGLPWAFVVIDESEFLAFSLPGGVVAVTRGLIDRCADEAELAGLLAHEIAHGVNRHHLQALQRALQGAGGTATWAALTRHVYLVGAGAEAEYAADREAVLIAARAGLDPLGLVSALVQVNALGDSDLPYADAHPASRLRLDQLERALGKRLDAWADATPAATIDQRLAAPVPRRR